MSSDENDSGARGGKRSEGTSVLAKEGVGSKQKGLVVIGLVATFIISGSFFAGKLFWDVQQRQSTKILERLEALEGKSAEQDRLNLAADNLDADFEQIEIWALKLEQKFEVLSGELTSIREGHSGSREWEARYRRVASQIDKLSREVSALQESSSEQKLSQGGALLLLARLRVNLLQGRPCAVQLKIVRTLLSGVEEFEGLLETLASACENGVLTRSQLEREFRLVARDMMSSIHRSMDGGWRDRIRGMFRRLVTIRPINPDGNSKKPADVLANTEAFLMSGNLSDALATIGKLSVINGRGASWINSLKQRVTAVETVDQIMEVLIKETQGVSGQNE